MTKFAVIGASGQVGHHLMEAARARGEDVTGTYSDHPVGDLVPLDIRDAGAIATFFATVRPTAVLVPAAIADVDGCEREPQRTRQVNVEGVDRLARVAAQWRAKFVHFSSDYVFDGEAGPYGEDDEPKPICEYGRQKLDAEQCVRGRLPNALIVRTTWVYGNEPQSKNFVARLVTRLEASQTVSTPDDQLGNPTYARDLADAVLDLVGIDASGTFNVVGPERMSRTAFAERVASAFGLDRHLIEGCSTAELRQAARRPLNAGLETDKLRAALGRSLSGAQEGLRSMRRELRLVS